MGKMRGKLYVFTDQSGQKLFKDEDNLVHIDGLCIDNLGPAEGKQRMGKIGGPLRRIQDIAYITVQRFIEVHLHLQQVAVTDYSGKDIIEIMGYASGKLPYRFHLLRLHQLLLEFFAFRDVS
jgi:hypothetical protein